MGEKREGVVGNSETCSPWREGDGRVAAGGVQRRPAAVSRGGGALVCFRPREGAEDAQLDGLDLLVVLARLGGQRQRQNVGGGGEFGNGRRRRGSAGAAALQRGRGRARVRPRVPGARRTGLGFPPLWGRAQARPAQGGGGGAGLGRGLPWPNGPRRARLGRSGAGRSGSSPRARPR
jgi:hypothetical protein